jgi:sugar lactone lactonase YvrE
VDVARGAQLGPYVLDARLGAGGMGEVWRARDPRIGRTVAIKVLPRELRADEDRLRRFEQEARAVGALSHPNLLVLFDVGHADGAPYLVTELLEGESLRARLAGGPLPLRSALKIAADVARGLGAAHGAGITHRDIKPDNLFITADGRVKILDFGVAKLRRDRDDEDPGRTVTSGPETQAGAVVGTPAYMAPEQLAGRPVDARADLFALGVVLHEMLTGARPFAAETAIEEQAAILRAAPASMHGVPPAVESVVLRCLEKRPEARFQSAADLAFALDALVTSDTPRPGAPALAAGTAPSAIVAAKERRAPFRWPIAAAWALAGAAIAALAAWALVPRDPPARPEAPTATAPPWPALPDGGPRYRRVTFAPGEAVPGHFAPDGRSVIYSLHRGRGPMRIYRADLSQPSVQDLGLVGFLTSVSREGEIAYRASSQGPGVIDRVFPGAGGPRPVAEGATWASFAPDGHLAILRVGARGATIEDPIGTPIAHPTGGYPKTMVMSRDGTRIATIVHRSPTDADGRIAIFDHHGKEIVTSPEHEGINGYAWSPDDRELWFSTWTGEPSRNAIFALGADGKERLLFHTEVGVGLQDVSADGRLLVTRPQSRFRLYAQPHGGAPEDRSWFDGTMIQGASKDGRTIAFVEAMGTGETDEGQVLWVRQGDAPPVAIGRVHDATITADGTAVIAGTSETAPLVRIPVGPGAPAPLPRGDVSRLDLSDAFATSWDGRWLVFRAAAATGAMRLWIQDLGGGAPRAIGPDAIETEAHPVSPDGALVAIGDDAGVRLISTAGAPDRVIAGPAGEQPVGFSGDGAALFVIDGDRFPRQVVRVALATGKRTPWATIEAPDRDLTDEHFGGFATDAAGDVFFSVMTLQSDLYVIEPPAPATR